MLLGRGCAILNRVIKGRSCCRGLKKVRRETPEQDEEDKRGRGSKSFSTGSRKCKGPEQTVGGGGTVVKAWSSWESGSGWV